MTTPGTLLADANLEPGKLAILGFDKVFNSVEEGTMKLMKNNLAKIQVLEERMIARTKVFDNLKFDLEQGIMLKGSIIPRAPQVSNSVQENFDSICKTPQLQFLSR